MQIKENKKELLLLLFILSIGAFLLMKAIPTYIDPMIKATIHQQRNSIQSMNTPRDTIFSKTLFFNTLDFPESTTFKHKTLGETGFKNHFFVDFEANIEVKQTDAYNFLIYSDDGFRLLIDDVLICEFVENRPFNKTECLAQLPKGNHRVLISYYQGFSFVGIQAYYKVSSINQYEFFGKDSKLLHFKEMK